MNFKIIVFFLYLSVSTTAFGQIEKKDIPFAFNHKIEYTKIEPFFLKRFDKIELLDEDKENMLLKQYSFAQAYETYLCLDKEKPIKTNNLNIFYKEIIVPDAEGIALTFSNFFLQKGEKIFIFDKLHKYLIGALTKINNTKNGILPTRFIPADTLIIEYQLEEKDKIRPIITTIAGAYRKLDIKSEPCEVNINCDSDLRWQTIKHAVAKIIFENKKDKKYYACTGSLIANTKQNNTPYFITANHCISTEDEANSAVFYFNYESPTCAGDVGDESQSIAGASLKATADNHLDFSLLLLSKIPPESFLPYYVGWDRTTHYSDTSVCIHHPDGDIKKISKDYDKLGITYFTGYDYDKHWKVTDWDQGSTEGGSSGAGLFTTEALLIGTLSGGFADCNNDLEDDFQQFYHDWDDYNEANRQLNHWLDPFNFDPPKMNGYYPYKNINLNVPANFEATLYDSVVTISWEPVSPAPEKYIIYKNLEVFDEQTSPQVLYDKLTETGVYVYYATAVYAGQESKPSQMKSVVLGDTSSVAKITEITVYPNPSSGQYTIISPDTIPLTKIEVINSLGKIIRLFNVPKWNKFNIDLSDLEVSLYFLRIYTTGEVYRKKILIIK